MIYPCFTFYKVLNFVNEDFVYSDAELTDVWNNINSAIKSIPVDKRGQCIILEYTIDGGDFEVEELEINM